MRPGSVYQAVFPTTYRRGVSGPRSLRGPGLRGGWRGALRPGQGAFRSYPAARARSSGRAPGGSKPRRPRPLHNWDDVTAGGSRGERGRWHPGRGAAGFRVQRAPHRVSLAPRRAVRPGAAGTTNSGCPGAEGVPRGCGGRSRAVGGPSAVTWRAWARASRVGGDALAAS